MTRNVMVTPREADSSVGELLVQTSKSFLADAAGDAGDHDDH